MPHEFAAAAAPSRRALWVALASRGLREMDPCRVPFVRRRCQVVDAERHADSSDLRARWEVRPRRRIAIRNACCPTSHVPRRPIAHAPLVCLPSPSPRALDAASTRSGWRMPGWSCQTAAGNPPSSTSRSGRRHGQRTRTLLEEGRSASRRSPPPPFGTPRLSELPRRGSVSSQLRGRLLRGRNYDETRGIRVHASDPV